MRFIDLSVSIYSYVNQNFHIRFHPALDDGAKMKSFCYVLFALVASSMAQDNEKVSLRMTGSVARRVRAPKRRVKLSISKSPTKTRWRREGSNRIHYDVK